MSYIQRPVTYQRRSIIPTPAASGRSRTYTFSRILKTPVTPPPPPPVLTLTEPQTSIVVPVMNEAANILPLIERIKRALVPYPVEVIFVDDSRDTLSVEIVEEARAIYNDAAFDVRIFHRTGDDRWGGLSGAVADGMDLARASHVLVMDGDLQHPPETIPAMLAKAQEYDMVVASRYRKGGSAAGLSGSMRHFVSRTSTALAKLFFPLRLRSITDPLTGFFLFDKTAIDRSRLRPKGFKILLEILATHPRLTKTEVPLRFAERLAGESHGSFKQGLEFFGQLLDLRFGKLIRFVHRLPKFVVFGAIGGSVFVAGMALLYGLVARLHMSALPANGIQLAFTFWLNYVLNRHITWREREISRRAAYKFLISRAATTVINFFLFAWLIHLSLELNILGHSIKLTLHYITANIVTLLIVTALNYEISDRWAFAAQKVRPAMQRAHTTGISIAISLMLTLVVAIGAAIAWNPRTVLPIILVATSLALFFQASFEVWRMVYSFREPDSIDRLRFPEPDGLAPTERFCIIVPARHESTTLAHTLTLLARQTHPNVDIISVICDDDMKTLEVAAAVEANEPRVHVLTYPLQPGTKPSKPLQLNYVLEQTTENNYSVIGVFDAEDTVHPELLMHVEAAFRDQDVDIVQGGVQLMNHDSSWFALHNVLEYYRWFNSAMVYNAEKEFMPLGGNTVFIRSKLLREAGGWPVTLTEDCSLGVLLSSRFGARTAVYYDPKLATREEAPSTLRDLFKQRVRWNQGFVHEWRAGTWLELPTLRQCLLASYVLISPLVLAVISILAIVSIVSMYYLKAAVVLVMITYLPLVPGTLLAILNGIFLHDFGVAFRRKITLKHYVVLFATQYFYPILLNLAALWSVVREMRGENSWHKTAHSGLHRTGAADIFDIQAPAYAYAEADALGGSDV